MLRKSLIFAQNVKKIAYFCTKCQQPEKIGRYCHRHHQALNCYVSQSVVPSLKNHLWVLSLLEGGIGYPSQADMGTLKP